MIQDLRFGIRMLLKHKAFTAVALLTLTLGIGANTAIFSVEHAVLLRPLPFAQQDQLVALWKQDTASSTPFVELSLAEVRDWDEQSESFSNVAALPATVYGYGYVLTGRGDALQLESAKVTGAFFSVLGVQAAIGRVFNEADDQLNRPKIVVLSDRVWRERFDANPQIVGKSITLTEEGFTVVGVMPPTFEFPKGVDLWLPIRTTVSARATEMYGMSFLTAVARLEPGVTHKQAEDEMNAIVARIAAEHPETEALGIVSSSPRSRPICLVMRSRRYGCCWQRPGCCCSSLPRISPTCRWRGRQLAAGNSRYAQHWARAATDSFGNCWLRVLSLRYWAGRAV